MRGTGHDPNPPNDADLDALIVGAGPTGLALAAQLRAFGARFRIIDRLVDRTRESRALAVQARTLELLQQLGLGEALVARGSTSTRLVLHLDARRVADVELGEIGARDTRFPFILIVSQAETEALLAGHLAARGVTVERGVELAGAEAGAAEVRCMLRHRDGREEDVQARYLVGCDGAHSTVRGIAGIDFQGGSYPQTFVLGDIEADGPLTSGAINSFAGRGVAMFFPLGRPTTWRVIAMVAGAAGAAPSADTTRPHAADLALADLQALVDAPTGGCIRIRDPAWLARFQLHHRQTTRYRAGRIFLAGDAAHIHSPVGGQGMNTGIQDAWNLGWKLALVARGMADSRLLDTYEAERWPVGRLLIRYTDRAFGTLTRVMSSTARAAWVRRALVSRVLPLVLGSRRLRARAFRFISELGIRYRRSPAVNDQGPRARRGPRAGDRLPDALLALDGRATWLQQAIASPHLTLLLCGPPNAWDEGRLSLLGARHPGLLEIRRLTRSAFPAALVDEGGGLLGRLCPRDAAQYLVRPDGYIAFRRAGRELHTLDTYLSEWYSPRPRSP